MPICTLTLTYEVYEGSLGTYGPLPLLSWTVYVNGLNEQVRRGMQKFFPELQDSVGGSLTFSQNDRSSRTGNSLNIATTMSINTTYLNWLDNEGFRVVGNTFDSSVYSGGVTKTILYTLQM